MKYYKITNRRENHNGYQYQDGLNLLDKRFQVRGTCVAGGLYFTTLEHIHNFYNYGCWLREVEIPEEAQLVKDSTGDKWRADMIILKKKYPLYSTRVAETFNLKVNTDYIKGAAEFGSSNIFQYIKNQYIMKPYDVLVVYDIANQTSNFSVLEMLYLHYHYIFLDRTNNYKIEPLYDAVKRNDIPAFAWWTKLLKNHSYLINPYEILGIAFQRQSYSMIYMILESNIIGSGAIKAINYSLGTFLSDFGYPDRCKVMKFLTENTKTSLSAMVTYACMKGIVSFLEWLVEQEKYFELETNFITVASAHHHTKVLEWWKKSGLPFIYDDEPFEYAVVTHNYPVMDWWVQSELPLKYNPQFYKKIVKKNKKLKKWWKKNKLPKIIKYY